MLRYLGVVLLLTAAVCSGRGASGGEPAPREGEEGKDVREIRREIEDLKKKLREQEKLDALEKERDELKKRVAKEGDGKDSGDSGSGERFKVDRSGLTMGIGVVTVDAGFTLGHKSNLAEMRRDREDDSCLRPNFDLLWLHAPGIIALLHAEENLFFDHDEEDYSKVTLATVFWGVGYGLDYVSDTSNFVTDRIEMTRHRVAIDPRMSLKFVDGGVMTLLVPSVAASFVSSGDLKYDAMTVEFGSVVDDPAKASGREAGENSEEGGKVTWSLGLTRRWYETKGFKDELALIGEVKYDCEAGNWDVEVAAASRLEDDLFAFAGHKRVSDLGVEFNWDPDSRVRLTLGAAGGVEDFDAGEDLYDEDRRDFFVRGRLGANLKVFPHGILSAAYVPELRESSIDEFDAAIHKLEFGIKLTF